MVGGPASLALVAGGRWPRRSVWVFAGRRLLRHRGEGGAEPRRGRCGVQNGEQCGSYCGRKVRRSNDTMEMVSS